MKLRTTLTAAALSLAALGAFAQTPAATGTDTPKADARQAAQQAKIEKGTASGALTSTETKKLEAGQAHVTRVEDRAKADGTVTKAEKAHIAHEQNQQKRRIHRNKHDAQTAAKPAA